MSKLPFLAARQMQVFDGRNLQSISNELSPYNFRLAYATEKHYFEGKSFCFTRKSIARKVYESAHFLSTAQPGILTLVLAFDLSPNTLDGPCKAIDLEKYSICGVFDIRCNKGRRDLEETLLKLAVNSPPYGDLAAVLAEETRELRKHVSSIMPVEKSDGTMPRYENIGAAVERLLPKPWNIPAENEMDLKRCRQAYVHAATLVAASRQFPALAESVRQDLIEVVAGRLFDPELYRELDCTDS